MLHNYLKSFKAYDIRGVYQTEVDEKLVYILGRAIWKYFKKKYWLDWKFLLAKDVRPANDKIIPYFIQWFTDIWLDKNNINFVWLCSTSISYYIWQWDFDLSVNFTASHNPPKYVGMKFFDSNTVFLSQSLLKEIFTQEYNELQKSNFDFSMNLNKNSKLEYNENTKVSQLFSFLYEKYQKLNKKHKFVVDFSNGAGTKFEKEFFNKLQKEWNEIFFINENPDWNFPNHLSDTQDYENYEQCLQKVKEENAEFGIMFDGDADRIWFVWPDWQIVWWDILLTILSKQVLSENNWKNSSQNIVYEVMCSKSIKEEVEKLWWNAILYKMWRFFIKEKMDEVEAILWWETSWHFMFKEIWWYEMPLLALFYIIKELELGNSFKEMIQNYKKYPKSQVFSKKVEDKNQTIEKIKNEYKNFKQKTIDWISVFGEKFWFNVRGSNTENKIRYTLEADTEEILQQELKKLEEIL